MSILLRRREFITVLGGAAAWPLAASAQQRVTIGYLGGRSSESDASMMATFRRTLKELGYVEGENLAIEYRFADGRYDRLPALAADLVGRHVAVIVSVGVPLPTTYSPSLDRMWGLLRASQIPIVFTTAHDPVSLGLVASINHPGGTMTGVSSFLGELTAKHLELLHNLVPNAKTIGLLDEPPLGEEVRDARDAAAALGLQLIVFEAGTENAIDAAFETMSRQRPAAMLVTTSPFYFTLAKQIAALAARHCNLSTREVRRGRRPHEPRK